MPEPYILHRENGKWQIAVDTVVQGDPTNEGLGRELHGLTFSDYNPTSQCSVGRWAPYGPAMR